MTVVTWLALGVFVLAVGSGLLTLMARALDAWRAVRSIRRTLGRGLGDLERRVTDVETRVAHIGENAAKLDHARQRLERSLATAALLAGAAGETRSALGRIRGLVPRK
jgi:hypothetical protein